jgi:hypothetical protein
VQMVKSIQKIQFFITINLSDATFSKNVRT